MKKKIALLSCGWAHNFVMDFINGVKNAVKDSNTDIYVFNCYNFTEYSGFPNATGFSIYSLINYEEYDGIIILGDLIANPRILEKERLRIIASKKPAICINCNLKQISCLRLDNYSGFYEIISHLITKHNVKKFRYIGGSANSFDNAERYKAYRTALTDNNIKVELEKVHSLPLLTFSDSYQFVKELFSNPENIPEALVCATDYVALGALLACDELKIKVPEQVKIVGFDDILFSSNVSPAITTVRNNVEAAGSEAAKFVLSNPTEIKNFKISNTPVYRESCGCNEPSIKDTTLFSLNILNNINKTKGFSFQMQNIEEIFSEAADVFTLLTNLELFFQKSHVYEGKDFCIFLKSDWSSVFVNSSENLPLNLSYGNQVQAIISIQNNQKYPREIISTKDLVPKKMIEAEKGSVFLLMPIFHHSYVHGYFVSKNDLSLVDEHFGYQWTHTFGNSIERFRKRNMYKLMSHEYLKLSVKDALSGMMNRVGMERIAKPFYAQNKKNGLTTVLFFVDINSMKTINDKFGHLHGDLAVKTIAQAVIDTVPRNWVCVRYGGDEFLVVGNSKNYNGEDYCTAIQQTLAKKTANMKLPYNLSASVGTYSVPPSSPLTLEEAVEKVDEIMYEKKQAFHREH